MVMSKGTDFFVYVSQPECKVLLASRGSQDLEVAPPKPGQRAQGPLHTHREIDIFDIGAFEHTGRMGLDVTRNGTKLWGGYAETAPSTGNLGATNLGDLLRTPSVCTDDYAISYGFYDAAVGQCHQAYVYVTDNQADWMGRVLASQPELKKQPLSILALPGAHDAGMFRGLDTDEAARALLDGLIGRYVSREELAAALAGGFLVSTVVTVLMPVMVALAGALIALKSTSMARRALINLAYTQKDNIQTQLLLGTRFFDFRPGYNAEFFRSDQVLRHQHGFIPGHEFSGFLADVVGFLKDHPSEIVVVNIKYSGFLDNNMRPGDDDVARGVDNALTGTSVVKGDLGDLKRPIGDLLKEHRRLIVLFGTDGFVDSYSDAAYATSDVDPVLRALDGALNDIKPETQVAVLQLQGTWTNTNLGLARAVATMSDASSPLLSTKSRFDHATYPWVEEHAAVRSKDALLVLLNDFSDNALVDSAVSITLQRLASRVDGQLLADGGELQRLGLSRKGVVLRSSHPVTQLGGEAWSDTRAMTSLDGSLYVIQNNKLWRANPGDGSYTQLGDEVWSNTNAMTSLGGWLYVIQNGKLWRANPGDGSYTQLGGEEWNGTAAMTAGPNGLLYVVQNGKLWRVNPNDGAYAQLGGQDWNDTRAMTSVGGALHIIQNGKLWRANPNDGAYIQLGGQDWNDTAAMTAGPDGKLYVVQNSKLWRAQPDDGRYERLYDSNWKDTRAMACIDRRLYIIQNNRLWQVKLPAAV